MGAAGVDKTLEVMGFGGLTENRMSCGDPASDYLDTGKSRMPKKSRKCPWEWLRVRRQMGESSTLVAYGQKALIG